MQIGLCDRPDQLGARIYRALQVDCGCCTFWRGVLLGVCVGFFVAGGALVAAGV